LDNCRFCVLLFYALGKSAIQRSNNGNAGFIEMVRPGACYIVSFATLTEVPILQGLIASGMGKSPALALLMAGPSLSLPNMLVIRGVMGTQKTAVYVTLVVLMATISGLVYGTFLKN
jgi:uncharacterized membrane protein YraQ (UPF0718 family)